MDHTREAAIRARAYQLWIESGYADGQQEKHWRQAEREMTDRERAGGTPDGAPTTANGRTEEPSVPHSDGTSRHPSVFDPKASRAKG